MSIVPTITPGSITGMTGLTERPVFFLNLNNSPTPNLVVKGDYRGMTDDNLEDIKTSIKWSSKLMKNVQNNLVNTKIMNPAEIVEFNQRAIRGFPQNSAQYKYAANTNGFTWVKMPYVTGLSDSDYYTKEDDLITEGSKTLNIYDSAKVKESIKNLLSEQVWRDLGKVVAVDIFNGNGDRFHVANGEWINKGNIMFLQNGQTAVIGLDTFDGNNIEPVCSLLRNSFYSDNDIYN